MGKGAQRLGLDRVRIAVMRSRIWLLPAFFGAVLYRGVTTGALTVDTGIGRRTHVLGPVLVHIDAAPEIVFDVISGPYLHKTPKAMEAKLRVIERGEDLVLAEHFTDIGGGMRSTTLETVRFERPHRVYFRLVRGPVPEVIEVFDLGNDDGGTAFSYEGSLGTDFWGLGEWWGRIVAKKWVSTVESSVREIKEEAERRARAPGRS